MASRIAKPRMGTRGRPEESRAAILNAAIQEFSRAGVAGARTDAIAQAARVNKALLYYYFKDKESLYTAAIDHVFGGLVANVDDILARNLPPKEKILAYVGTHFDYIARHPLFPRIVHGEFLRAGWEKSPHFERLVKQYFRPLFEKLSGLIRQGQASGDFRPVDPYHFVPSMIAIIVHYFNSAPAFRILTGKDPFTPPMLAARRAALLDFVSAALFRPATPPAQGERH
ncbi:MAG: TetR family transcriptional regulator [Acidobacteria bacterium]|jgi:TetR/AcrR family transcriptional regulator|nr:TetR family transcriptional regulator [Acidobacteriota bacterium]